MNFLSILGEIASTISNVSEFTTTQRKNIIYSLTLMIIADGKIEDEEIELAIELIKESNIFYQDKLIDELNLLINEYKAINSPALIRMRAKKLLSNIEPHKIPRIPFGDSMSSETKEDTRTKVHKTIEQTNKELFMMIEGILEACGNYNNQYNIEMFEEIKDKVLVTA